MAVVRATINPVYHNKVVAFNKSSLPLGKRDDINELAILAHESGDKSLLRLFDRLPDLASLKKTKTDQQLGRTAGPAEKGELKK